MQIKVKLFSVGGVAASDGSIIPRHVVEEYLASDKYKSDIACKKMLGSLSHRCRAWNTQKTFDPSIAKTAGKDDQLITIGAAAPTHVVEKVWIDNTDGWVYVLATILDENGMDDEAIQNIRRLKGMLSQGIMPGSSAVILGYWDSGNSGTDTLKKLVSLKGFDITLNPSWKDSTVVETIGDSGEVIASAEKSFSELDPSDFKFDGMKVKTFSDLSVLGVSSMPKTSKIDNCFTSLKGKVFSADGVVEDASEIEEVVKEEPIEKTYSVASLKERLRISKMSPRMRFRRLFIDYKQAVRSNAGGKLDPETEKVMKSMFATDVLEIIKVINPDIMSGKQINTLIGASSLGKSVRVAAQNLQMPYRYAMQEISKTGKISPTRYQKIQEAYTEFIKSLTDEVFGASPLPEGLTEEAAKEEGGTEDVKK
jgi:hypothetical protein